MSDRTLKLFEARRHANAYAKGYKDGCTGADSREDRFANDGDFIAYLAGYVAGSDKTLEMIGEVG